SPAITRISPYDWGWARGVTTKKVKATLAISQKNFARLSFCFSVRRTRMVLSSYRPPHHVCHHTNESRMIVHRAGADEIQAVHCGELFCLGVKIIKDFDMIADEADRHDHHLAHASGGESKHDRPDVWLKTVSAWVATAA